MTKIFSTKYYNCLGLTLNAAAVHLNFFLLLFWGTSLSLNTPPHRQNAAQIALAWVGPFLIPTASWEPPVARTFLVYNMLIFYFGMSFSQKIEK